MCLAQGAGCGGGRLGDAPDGGGAAGINVVGAGGAAGAGTTGVGGSGPPPDPCLGAADPRMVIAQQRTLLLTHAEAINMVQVLVGDSGASAVLQSGSFSVAFDSERHFPPADGEDRSLNETSILPFNNLARVVGQYASDNFAIVTRCAPLTDACATTYLSAFAERAYRRPLDAAEQNDLQARWDDARAGGTIEDATRQVIAAILVAPPFLFRSEQGDPARASASPPGVPLTPYELASALSFFLTDGPPDALLRADARAGTLTPETVGPHVERLLATAPARAWLRTVMELFYRLNQLPLTPLDPKLVPEANSGLFADMQTEARMFLDFTLWNGALTDLLTSRTTFLNARLATTIYKLPLPAGVTATTFVQTTLPADQRSGLITNPGFLTVASRTNGTSLVHRGSLVNSGFVGLIIGPPPDTLNDPKRAQVAMLDSQTPQQQVAYRAAVPLCRDCHQHFDPYGLALGDYDAIGRFRTVDERGTPVDAHATLPPEIGGTTVAGAIDLAAALARSPVFVNQLAWALLQYAMVDWIATVERPSLAGDAPRAACAVNDVVARFRSRPAQTFAALIQEVAMSPAFAYRQQIPLK